MCDKSAPFDPQADRLEGAAFVSPAAVAELDGQTQV
jgi:hypothetical protein